MTKPPNGAQMAAAGAAAIGAFVGLCYFVEYAVRNAEHGGFVVVMLGLFLGWCASLASDMWWKRRMQAELDRLKEEHRKEVASILRHRQS